MNIKVVKERIEGLSQREKIISVITLAIIVVFIPYIFFYSPSSAKVKSKQQILQDLKKEIESINITLSSQTVSQSEIRGGEKEPITEKISLPEVEDLSGMLAAISREANMAKVDFISIAPEGFEYKDKFIEMKVKIELRVRFRELYEFLKNIETRHKLFLVHDLKFETNSAIYPSGIALLKAVTYLRKKE